MRLDTNPDDPGSPGTSPTSAVAENVDEVGLLGLGSAVLSRWRLVVGLPFAVAVVTAVVSLLLPRYYRATATFVPEASVEGGASSAGGLLALASQFGVSVPGSGGSPKFYEDVLRSRTLRDELLLTRFPDPRTEVSGDSATLLDMIGVKKETPAKRLDAGRARLARRTFIRVEPETKLVTVGLETRYPVLAAQVLNRYLELLSRFNLETRQSNAKERRRFVEERQASAGEELRAAEAELERFLQGNRLYEHDAQLRFQYERLQRQVTIKTEVFTALRRQYEEARIEEVKDTPVITVIDAALPPEYKARPRRKRMVLFAFLGSGVAVLVWVFGQDFVERSRQRNEQEYQRFASRWAALKADLRSLASRRRPAARQ